MQHSRNFRSGGSGVRVKHIARLVVDDVQLAHELDGSHSPIGNTTHYPDILRKSTYGISNPVEIIEDTPVIDRPCVSVYAAYKYGSRNSSLISFKRSVIFKFWGQYCSHILQFTHWLNCAAYLLK